MRKRLGAFHAESIEQYIQLSQHKQELQNKYEVKEMCPHAYQYEEIDKDTNVLFGKESIQTSTKEEEIDQKEYCSINVLIVDNCDQIDEIFKYCNTPRQPRSHYHLEYCSKVESTNSKENHFHFWIINQESSKYQELINGISQKQQIVYFSIADIYIYLYHKSFEPKFQSFTEKVKSLNKKENKVIYKIVNNKRISSMNNFQDKEQVREITLQSLGEVIKRVKDQYF
ncbi:unnamed protein product (macronuclear) [Paramecium tetraurelia]|uniref:Uncharacterized protein n=1 Tax=Paramecium tetraurelia TaxID=5888 RepID=A0DN97_PARTE|nr:uncharacterized protein GSPATT00018719001 [Paramecium tetraurelia]CAK84514.1 unnamed protein product [Paramecium tetraurelia]|eukprot:XP_001451911.1 hypothetical protein (macronuclear) [Paramecium tetraurelia strain d4-2]